MRKTLALLIVALAIPSVALAAKQPKVTTHSKASAKVTYILKGTLSNYVAATTTTGGSITINVTHSNFHGRALRGKTLTFAVSAKTMVVTSSTFRLTHPKLHGARISNGTRGIVKFRAPLRVSNTTLLAALAPQAMTAAQVIVH